MVSRIGRALAVGALLGAAFGAPVVAHAAEAAPSIVATAPYNLDFTLPTESKSGCMVCHGDPALVRVRAGAVKSFYIDAGTVAHSAHFDQQCVGCHLDFTYKAPHGNGDWTTTAKSACRNCHDEASVAFGIGVHRATVPTATAPPAPVPAVSAEASIGPKPLCGDCHGAHDISMLTTDTPAARDGREALHKNGFQVCGRCHQDYWGNYDDYYHGAAFKRGARDAPSCWDCHGWHEILPSDDRSSTVNEAHLVETCGGGNLPATDPRTCHVGVDEKYVEYAVFIHGRETITAENWLHALVRRVKGAVGSLFGGGD